MTSQNPNSPLTWMDAMEQVRDRFAPALTVETLAPRIEALYAEQGLPCPPGQAEAAAEVCLAHVPPEEAHGSSTAAPRDDRKAIAWVLGVILAVSASLGIYVGTSGTTPPPLSSPASAHVAPAQPIAMEAPDPVETAYALAFANRLTDSWAKGEAQGIAQASAEFTTDGWLDFLKARPREWTTADPSVISSTQVRTGPTLVRNTLFLSEESTLAWVFETPLRRTTVTEDAQGHRHTQTQEVQQTLVVRSQHRGPLQVTHMEVDLTP